MTTTDFKLLNIRIAFLLTSSLYAASTQASESPDAGWYLVGKVGRATLPNNYNETNYNATRWEFDDGNNLAVSIGHAIETLSIELEYSYRKFDAKRWECHDCGIYQLENLSGEQIQRSLLFMGYWTLLQNQSFSPFLGFGAGYTKISWRNVTANLFTPTAMNSSYTTFTYKITAGIEFMVNKKTSVSMAYSYLKPEDIEVRDESSTTHSYGTMDHQEMNIIDLGIKYKF